MFHDAHRGCLFFLQSAHDLFASSLTSCFSVARFCSLRSGAAGRRDIIEDMALAGVAAGADGLIIETHIKPEEAVSDGPQSLYPDQYQAMTKKVWQLHSFMQGLND